MSSQIEPEKDRITLAWELRRDIHAWIVQHSRATMQDIFAAFSPINHETLRKAVYRMRTDGDVAMVGRNRQNSAGVYAAITQRIKSEEAKRRALAKGALKTQKKAVSAWRKKAEEKKAQQKETAAKPTGPVWLTRNIDPNRKPIRNQGGQGAVRRDVTVQSSAEMI